MYEVGNDAENSAHQRVVMSVDVEIFGPWYGDSGESKIMRYFEAKKLGRPCSNAHSNMILYVEEERRGTQNLSACLHMISAVR